MQVLDSIQHLEDEAAGIPLRVEAFFHNSVKQLTARHPAARDRAVWPRQRWMQRDQGGGSRDGDPEQEQPLFYPVSQK
ncbi:hypothetical protein Celaphus_00010327 [Cervus elaphus hippelaphus]|uniref:Uncharacterized protein n=1 Tax=Cervus elaphus hippelaphus TaxID=46360 RepID=A0A212C960_CEREH|nr:hypothetical protein Celaphus_00010327 [Cervus elaphus hippelaphus]